MTATLVYTPNRTVPADPAGLSECGDWSLGGVIDCSAKGGKKVVEEVEQIAVAVRNTPATIGGYAFAEGRGGTCRFVWGDLTVRCYQTEVPGGADAMTLGSTVITGLDQASYDDNADLIDHEYQHSKQWALFGPFFIRAYYGGAAYSKATTGSWACNNPFETTADLHTGGYHDECGC